MPVGLEGRAQKRATLAPAGPVKGVSAEGGLPSSVSLLLWPGIIS